MSTLCLTQMIPDIPFGKSGMQTSFPHLRYEFHSVCPPACLED